MESSYQEEQPGCGRRCLGFCCIVGAKLPVYWFSSRRLLKFQSSSGDEEQDKCFLDMLILAKWEERSIRGLLRYDVTACETKVLPGELGFVAQLNEGRHSKKRPTEFPIDQVLQGFDLKKFNFTKVSQEEALFCFEDRMNEHHQYSDMMLIGGSRNMVLVNVSPIEYGHVLLVPRLLDCKPQRIDIESLRLAVCFAAEAGNSSFRVGYNSLGAFATVNHLHFQAYYLGVAFAVERAQVTKIAGCKSKGMKLFELSNYVVKGLVYESNQNLEELADCVAKACMNLQALNIPFNVLIADCGHRIFLFPQCFVERQALGQVDPGMLETQVNPAVWEISGHIVLKRRADYETVTEEFASKLLSQVSLSEVAFIRVKNMCLETFIAPNDEVNARESLAYCLEVEKNLVFSANGISDCVAAVNTGSSIED